MSTQASVAQGGFDPSILSVARWYAVQTSCRHEKQVAMQLVGKAIEHLLPVYQEVHQWHDRKVRVEMPLFPGYLFVRIMPGQRLDVLTVPGVAKLVGFHAGPVAIDDAEIAALHCGMKSGIALQPHPYLNSGRRVRVCAGALSGIEGILVRQKDESRIVISVDLIMQSVSMEIDVTDVEIIG